MDIEFQGFPKIPRLSRECIITEKIDGTNAQVIIEEFDPSKHLNPLDVVEYVDLQPIVLDGLTPEYVDLHRVAIYAGSKSRIITPDNDNHGFARWVKEHATELAQLGPGRHFGEWWGQGIQRAYGLKEKRFSLFNTSRWAEDDVRPECCHVVPVLYQGMFSMIEINDALMFLEKYGSLAATGFSPAEGVCIFHTASGHYYKKTILNDEKPKGE